MANELEYSKTFSKNNGLNLRLSWKEITSLNLALFWPKKVIFLFWFCFYFGHSVTLIDVFTVCFKFGIKASWGCVILTQHCSSEITAEMATTNTSISPMKLKWLFLFICWSKVNVKIIHNNKNSLPLEKIKKNYPLHMSPKYLIF